jgi:predicted RecB family nuclease
MEPDWNLLQAMSHCANKAWLLSRNESCSLERETLSQKELQVCQSPGGIPLVKLSSSKIILKDKVVLTAWSQTQTRIQGVPFDVLQIQLNSTPPQILKLRTGQYARQAEKLRTDVQEIISNDSPPPFYKNPHCPNCQFKEYCHKKLVDRDCLSLLGGMTAKTIAKYHNKGIFSITQLSHIFRPRRRGGRPQSGGSFLWELKALALREKKTFVMHPPEIEESPVCIYIDFEGMEESKWQYLLGGLIRQAGKADEFFSFWANSKEEEREIFRKLLTLLGQYPDAPVYHYGSYEPKALKQASRDWGGKFKQEFSKLEKRMVNILGYLRTHVYPPTYTNGLKEVAGFLGFNWTDSDADGLRSMEWRGNWESCEEDIWKEKLLRYNQEDCLALVIIHQWFQHLALEADNSVQRVSEMKKISPYKFHDNPEYSEDFKHINKAAYFDYQRNKIYWRNKGSSVKTPSRLNGLQPRPGRGVPYWKPKQVNEIVIAPPLKRCPRCGGRKIYNCRKGKITSFRQTDIKFTVSGIKKWVTEYRSGRCKCAKCRLNFNNRVLRMMHYGDNLFAWAINLYVRYHISHEMIARMIKEQFGIWINPMYLVQRKYKWLRYWKSEVEYLWKIVKNSPVMHIDETTVRLSKDRGYVWAFATPHTVFYHFTLTREVDFLHTWLKGYKGIIVTDSFPGYETLKVKQQKCLIHLIRDLNDDLFKNPFDEEYKLIVSEFGRLLRKIIDTIDKFGLKQKHLQKHIKETERFYKQILERIPKSELSIKYNKRLRKHWNELWTFLHHDNVPWNNNNAEAAIKAFAQYRRGVNGQIGEHGLREYLEMLSIAQTCRYRNLSFLNFLRRKTGIWENIEPESLPGFLPFTQARLFAQKLRFQRKRDWIAWHKAGKRPAFIPSSPHTSYKKHGWIGWHDWLGFSFLPFEEARTHMRRLGLKNRDEYWAWQRSGRRPKSIPASPEKIYKNMGWKDLGDWLGTGNLGRQRKDKLPYEQAKAYIQALGIKTQHEFFAWRKSGQRPETIPSAPESAYLEFKSWGDFLGTDRIANQLKEYWNWEKAKEFLAPLKIQSVKHFRELCSTGAIPKEIPKNPWAYYKKYESWNGYPDFWGKPKVYH